MKFVLLQILHEDVFRTLCQTSIIELFCKSSEPLESSNYFRIKLRHRCFRFLNTVTWSFRVDVLVRMVFCPTQSYLTLMSLDAKLIGYQRYLLCYKSLWMWSQSKSVWKWNYIFKWQKFSIHLSMIQSQK